MQPIVMPPNVIEHFYRGGRQIAALRGIDVPSANCPEEWLASTTRMHGRSEIGLSRTATGEFFRDVIIENPAGWLGVDSSSGDIGLLVKLLDAGQRLPVHVHPDRSFAASHLNCPYGKAEAWFVLGTTGDDPNVWLGWRDDVDPVELHRAAAAKDSQWLLSRMNHIRVRPGDGIFVPAGTAHAIGAGVFVAEVQEPTDFSLFLEWPITAADMDRTYLGLGLPVALDMTITDRLTAADLSRLITHTDLDAPTRGPVSLLSASADPYFRLDHLRPRPGETATMPAGFAVLIALRGSGQLVSRQSKPIPVAQGQVMAVPAAYGDWALTGGASVLACRPALPADLRNEDVHR